MGRQTFETKVFNQNAIIRFFKKQLEPPKLAGLSAGRAGEEWISYLYERKGFTVLHRNYEVIGTKKLGELDIVCRRGGLLAFIEVKSRRSEAFMPLEDTVGIHKQYLLRRMVELYLVNFPEYATLNRQIDLAFVLFDPVDNSIVSVRILENAIEGD